MALHKVIKVSAGGFSSALTSTGEAFQWGKVPLGYAYDPIPIEMPEGFNDKIVDIEIGGCFGALIDSAGHVYIWGKNTHGQLGLGNRKDEQQ